MYIPHAIQNVEIHTYMAGLIRLHHHTPDHTSASKEDSTPIHIILCTSPSSLCTFWLINHAQKNSTPAYNHTFNLLGQFCSYRLILQKIAEDVQHVWLLLHCLKDVLENESVLLRPNVTRFTHSFQGAFSDQEVAEQFWHILIQGKRDELIVEELNSTHSSIFS